MDKSKKYGKLACECFDLAKENCHVSELRKPLVKLGLLFRGMQKTEESDEYMQTHKD